MIIKNEHDLSDLNIVSFPNLKNQSDRDKFIRSKNRIIRMLLDNSNNAIKKEELALQIARKLEEDGKRKD